MATLKQLQTFIAVAEYKKMSQAAKHLHISQPTVSQIILDLEMEYHTQLFERSPKELHITSAGILLLNSAQEILAIHESLEQSMNNINSLRQLRIGTTLTIGNTMMSQMIKTLTDTYPDLDIYVFIHNTKMIEHKLINNELDIALVEGMIQSKEIFSEPIKEDSLQIFCGMDHLFSKKKMITLHELINQDFIMSEKGNDTRSLFENIMLQSHIPFRTKWECSSETAIMDAVCHNLGLGVLSERCIQDAVTKQEIHACTIQELSIKRSFYICYNLGHPITSQMKNFIDLAKKM